MTPTIQVGRSFQSLSLVVPLVFGSAALLFGFLETEPISSILFATAGVLLAVATAVGLAIAMSRRSIRVLDDRIQVRDRDGEREIPDSDVRSLSLATRSNFSQGVLKSVTNVIQIWVDDRGQRPIQMKHTVLSSSPDPLQGWLTRIAETLYQKSRLELESGRSIRGEGWTLDNVSFEQQREGRVARARLESLSAAELVDDNLCVWTKGEEHPAFSIPAASRDVLVLGRLLQDLIPSSETGEPPPGSLGRVLFERSAARSTVIGLYVLSTAFTVIGAAIVYSAGGRGDLANNGWIALGGGLAIGFLGFCLTQSTLRCHEYGVRRSGLFREKKLHYADVASFSYSATRQFINGVYSGTNLVMTFIPRPEVRTGRITYSSSLKHVDDELENLRDQVARLIGERMANDLARGVEVQWTPNLRFLANGLQYRAAGFARRKKPVLILYDDIVNFDVDEGTLHVWVRGSDKSVVQESVAQPNFFPGLAVLTYVLSDPA